MIPYFVAQFLTCIYSNSYDLSEFAVTFNFPTLCDSLWGSDKEYLQLGFSVSLGYLLTVWQGYMLIHGYSTKNSCIFKWCLIFHFNLSEIWSKTLKIIICWNSTSWFYDIIGRGRGDWIEMRVECMSSSHAVFKLLLQEKNLFHSQCVWSSLPLLAFFCFLIFLKFIWLCWVAGS